MSGIFKFLTALLVLIPIGLAGGAAHAEKRIALVIGMPIIRPVRSTRLPMTRD